MDTLIDTVAAELDAIFSGLLTDLEFSALVDDVVAERQMPTARTFYVLVPPVGSAGEWMSVFSDGSQAPATQRQLRAWAAAGHAGEVGDVLAA